MSGVVSPADYARQVLGDSKELTDVARAQGFAALAVADAVELVGSAVAALIPQMPRVSADRRAELALRMAEWWRESPSTATGERFERILDRLLDELGVSK